jgi:hypothetical protein
LNEGVAAGCLAQTFIVLICPCGFGILHGMRQPPPVFGHNARVASIEPPLAEWASGKVFGLERSALVCAGSAIGHIRRLQSLRRCADVPDRE